MRIPLSVLAPRWRTAVRGGTLPVLALASVFALASALPADAQASRTRPSGGTSSGTASSGSRTSSPPPATATPAPRSPTQRSAPAQVGRTRPGAGGGGRTVIERDARGQRPDRDVVVVNPWGWWHSYWWSYGAWGWYPRAWGPYGPYYGGYGPAWYPRRVHDRMGALDLDLKPGDTQIFLDGQYIGIADRFDGWPGYLWLDEGDYHFVFYREGYRTIAREYRVRPGLVIDVEDRLERGESVPPEELVPPQPTPRRDARIRRNEEMRRQAAEAEAAADEAKAAGDAGSDDGAGWRDRQPDVEPEDAGVGTLRLVVAPADASVYLDGRFLGTGAEVGRLRGGLAVTAGEHLIEVVRPGHAPVARRVVVEDGRDFEVEVALQPQV